MFHKSDALLWVDHDHNILIKKKRQIKMLILGIINLY